MAIRDALAPIIQLLLFILYGIYIFLGLILMIAGIYYVSQIEGANTFAAVVCIMCGFFMLIVGALAIFGNLKKNALIFAVVLLIDVALFVLLLSAMMVGMAIVNEVNDPVAKAVNEAYCDNPVESLNSYCKARTGAYSVDNEGVLLRQSVWDGVVQLFDNGAPASCKVYDASLRIQSKAKAADAQTCADWTEDLQVLPVAAVAESCEEAGCKVDHPLAGEPTTTCKYTASTDTVPAECVLDNEDTMKGTCDFTAEVVEVAAEPKCGKGDFTGCYYHVAESYKAPVAAKCVATAPAGSVGQTYMTTISEGDASVTELTVDGACVPTAAAEGTPSKAEHCLTTKAWAADLTDEQKAVQGSWEIDVAKECEAETICAMSQSMEASQQAVPASCEAIPLWGAATCTPISSHPSYSDACAAAATSQSSCEAVPTWVTSDDVAGTGGLVATPAPPPSGTGGNVDIAIGATCLGLDNGDACVAGAQCESIAKGAVANVCAVGACECAAIGGGRRLQTEGYITVGDKLSPPACEYTAAVALPACVEPDAAVTDVKAQRTTCMAVEGCAYTAATAAKVVAADGTVTPGACVAVSGEGSCTYKPTTPLVAAAECVPLVAETSSVTGTCQLKAGVAIPPTSATDTTPLYTDASCTFVSGLESTVTCKLTDAAGLDAAGVTGDGVLEECYEETHVDGDNDDEDGSCAFRRGTAEYLPSLCKNSDGSQVMGTCGTNLPLVTVAMTQTSCTVAGTGTGTCNSVAADLAACLPGSPATTPATSCVFTAATKTSAELATYVAADGVCAGTVAAGDLTAETVCGNSATCTWSKADCTYKAGMEDCNNIHTTTGLSVKAGDTAYAGAAEKMLVDPTCATAADCKTIGAGAGNCTEVFLAFGPATKHECKRCWADWQTYSIDKIKGNLWPATIVIWSLFLFVVILVCVNNYMIDNCEDDDGNFGPDGLWKIIGIVFNGIVALFGLLTMIMGIVAHSDLSGGCPEGKDCTNWAVVGVIVLGIFFILTAILSLVGMLIGKFPGMMMVRVADLILVLLGLLLLIMGIGFAIIAGAMDDINSANESNFAQVRAQYESEDPELCKGLSDSDCRSKIKDKTEGGMLTVVIILGLVCFEFIFVIFLTLQAFYIYKGGDGDDDDDDDDD